MELDLSRPVRAMPWSRAGEYWPALTAATARLDPPFAVLGLEALRFNVHDMLARATGKRIRVASKSVRVREVLDAVLAVPGYHGVLAYTLPEALWLAADTPARAGIDDVVVGYPTAHRRAIATLVNSPELSARVTLMVDSVEQLDLIDAVAAPGHRQEVRVCLEVDASWRMPLAGRIGVWRSPIADAHGAAVIARAIAARPGFRLVGMMSYEAQIAGQGDVAPGRPMWQQVVRWAQTRSKAELLERRSRVVEAVRAEVELEFVNGGGTGSLEFTASDPAITELAAGSGLLGGHLFDTYRSFHPAPAAAFALSVVRVPAPGMATLMGGGWVASGPPAGDRLPQPVWPTGLRMAPREMAGEVQTPVSGAHGLRVGDRVWLRHAKSGELSEHVGEFQVISGDQIMGETPTYRGEGKAFL